MKRITVLLTALCLLLSGCGGLFDGSHHTKTPYRELVNSQTQQIVSASNYAQLRDALADMVEAGVESGTISVEDMESEDVANNMNQAIRAVMTGNPIASYAVEEIAFEQGTSGGVEAVAVSIRYNSHRSEIRRIRTYQNADEAWEAVRKAVDACEDALVLRMSSGSLADYAQLIRSYADENPQKVMEVPQVMVSTYPESGVDRLVVLQFAYQTSRDNLKSMQEYVQPVFSAAKLYVRGDTEDAVKYAQLYAFLMERYDYTIQTSITPSYSLLRYGVGDSKAFAQVYAAMCRDSSLECMVVSGTYQGEARVWNMICVDGIYRHVDLLACSQRGEFALKTDAEMAEYVWDYSAYPGCAEPTE